MALWKDVHPESRIHRDRSMLSSVGSYRKRGYPAGAWHESVQGLVDPVSVCIDWVR